MSPKRSASTSPEPSTSSSDASSDSSSGGERLPAWQTTRSGRTSWPPNRHIPSPGKLKSDTAADSAARLASGETAAAKRQREAQRALILPTGAAAVAAGTVVSLWLLAILAITTLTAVNKTTVAGGWPGWSTLRSLSWKPRCSRPSRTCSACSCGVTASSPELPELSELSDAALVLVASLVRERGDCRAMRGWGPRDAPEARRSASGSGSIALAVLAGTGRSREWICSSVCSTTTTLTRHAKESFGTVLRADRESPPSPSAPPPPPALALGPRRRPLNPVPPLTCVSLLPHPMPPLSPLLRPQELRARDYLVRQGERADSMYAIASGTCAVGRSGRAGRGGRTCVPNTLVTCMGLGDALRLRSGRPPPGARVLRSDTGPANRGVQHSRDTHACRMTARCWSTPSTRPRAPAWRRPTPRRAASFRCAASGHTPQTPHDRAPGWAGRPAVESGATWGWGLGRAHWSCRLQHQHRNPPRVAPRHPQVCKISEGHIVGDMTVLTAVRKRTATVLCQVIARPPPPPAARPEPRPSGCAAACSTERLRGAAGRGTLAWRAARAVAR
jgi:hypothetical protein